MESSTNSLPVADADRLGVLVVDDDSQLLGTLSDILRHRGYEPSSATTGRQGLEMASTSQPVPAIALVDLALPDMSGLELVQELRLVSTLIEVVILTGNASLESAVGALREHSCDYLIKPVPPNRLVETLNRAGERWRRRRAEDALVRSERRLRLLVENISDLILILDAAGLATYASPAVESALGYRPEGFVGRRITDLVHDDDGTLMQGLLASPSNAATEIRIRRGDGSWGLFSCRASDLLGQPEVSGVMLVAQDVTEKRRLEEQALQAQKLDSIGRLAGGVAHDFNNLLSIVLGYSEFALQHPTVDGGVRRLLEDIHEAGERGSALTQHLLSFSRRQPAEPRLLDLNELIRGLERLLRRTLGEDIELVIDLDPDLGPVRADPARMEQVLMNLVVNARQAMVCGGRLRLTTRGSHRTPRQSDPTPEEGEFVLVEVRDTGVGMTQEVQERLFEPFFTTKETGTGLGLATTYGIVQQAGGQIAVESAPGEGTTMTVSLPRVGAISDLSQVATTDVAVPSGTETVLVVEDEPMVRNLVREILHSQGYEVLEASNGREALDLVRGSGARPDLLLTDVVMPEMGGEEIAARMSDVPGIRVLMMSGYSGRTGKEEGEAPRLLQKPFSPGTLARAVRAVLDAPAGD